jgi:transposase
MRGEDQQQNHMFSYLSPEQRVRKDHPLRAIRAMVDEVLKQLSLRFDSMYARMGRPSIAPEKLLRAQLLQMLYSVRSERLLMEEMDYNLLFRWFVGLNADDEVCDATTFTKNRDRLLEADVAKEFLAQVVERADARPDFGRAFHRGWHAAGGLGWGEEFSAQEESAFASAGRSRESHGELSWRKALEQNP